MGMELWFYQLLWGNNCQQIFFNRGSSEFSVLRLELAFFFLNFSSGVCGHRNPGQGGDGKEGKFKAITTVQLPTAMT